VRDRLTEIRGVCAEGVRQSLQGVDPTFYKGISEKVSPTCLSE
jgi:hypothetical protein